MQESESTADRQTTACCSHQITIELGNKSISVTEASKVLQNICVREESIEVIPVSERLLLTAISLVCKEVNTPA